MVRSEQRIQVGEQTTDLRASLQAVVIVFGFGALGVFLGLTALLF